MRNHPDDISQKKLIHLAWVPKSSVGKVLCTKMCLLSSPGSIPTSGKVQHKLLRKGLGSLPDVKETFKSNIKGFNSNLEIFLKKRALDGALCIYDVTHFFFQSGCQLVVNLFFTACELAVTKKLTTGWQPKFAKSSRKCQNRIWVDNRLTFKNYWQEAHFKSVE